MAELWVIGEPGPDGSVAKISTEAATLARSLAAAAGAEAVGIVVGADPSAAAAELAAFLPRVVAITDPDAADHAWSVVAAERIAELATAGEPPLLMLAGAGPDGRDLAGTLSALLGWGVLGNGTAAEWDAGAGGIALEMSILGGKLLTRSTFTGDRGIVTIRPMAVTAEPAAQPGVVETRAVAAARRLPAVKVLERVAERSDAVSIEEAKVIVAGGRGVGGPDGFRVVEALAKALGGAVGASRAAVDAGWIDYNQQIGQTGKIVKPSLYFALGISGAIQHKVGMQTAGTIVAVNRDPDAPIAEFADLMVVGDLFAVVPAVLEELKKRPS